MNATPTTPPTTPLRARPGQSPPPAPIPPRTVLQVQNQQAAGGLREFLNSLRNEQNGNN